MSERKGFQNPNQKRILAQYNRGVALAKVGRMEQAVPKCGV